MSREGGGGMSGYDRGACCLSLLDEKDLEGIVGVGVLLLSDLGNTVSAGSSFVLGKSGRALRELTMSRRASVVFVSNCTRQGSDVSKAVPVKVRWLQPWRVRVFGLKVGQNLLSEFSRFLNEKLGSSAMNCVQDGSYEDESYINDNFEVWCVDECWQESQHRSVGSKDSSYSASEICYASSSNSISLGCSEKCVCGFKDIIEEKSEKNIENLWEIAGFLAHKINYSRGDSSIRHFGLLVPKVK